MNTEIPDKTIDELDESSDYQTDIDELNEGIEEMREAVRALEHMIEHSVKYRDGEITARELMDEIDYAAEEYDYEGVL
jgi:hypothetical protein